MPSLDFCPTLRELYETRRVVGRSGKVFGEDLGALSTVNNLITLRGLMLELRPERTLETGMAFGGSSLVFAQSHKDLGREPAGQHTAVDAAQSTYYDDAGRLALERAGLSDYTRIVDAYTYRGLPRLLEDGCRFDLAYIDGSHQFEDVFLDFFYTHEMLSVGGVVLFDDSTHSHVRKVLALIKANYSEIYEQFPLDKYREGFKERLKNRVAARLHKSQLTAFRKLKDGRQNWGKPLKDF